MSTLKATILADVGLYSERCASLNPVYANEMMRHKHMYKIYTCILYGHFTLTQSTADSWQACRTLYV